ncbi:hypothetical protein V2J09_011868 [Rumex salicifolius]
MAIMMRRTKEIVAGAGSKQRRLISSTPSPPRYVRLGLDDGFSRRISEAGGDSRCGARKGYVPVMVGGEGVEERFLIPTQFMSHPSIVALLEMSADEFGYRQEGVLRIPCEPDCLREILKSLPFKKR